MLPQTQKYTDTLRSTIHQGDQEDGAKEEHSQKKRPALSETTPHRQNSQRPSNITPHLLKAEEGESGEKKCILTQQGPEHGPWRRTHGLVSCTFLRLALDRGQFASKSNSAVTKDPPDTFIRRHDYCSEHSRISLHPT